MKEIKAPNIDYQAEIKKCKTLEDVIGPNCDNFSPFLLFTININILTIFKILLTYIN